MISEVFIPALLPLVLLAVAMLLPKLVRSRPGVVASLGALVLALGSVAMFARVPGLEPFVQSWAWVPQLGVEFSLRLDAFNAWFAALVLGLGAGVVLHTGGYLAKNPRLPGALAALSGFTLAMLGVILADNLYLLFLFWEATSLLSFLLVGFHHDKEEVREKASQALLVTLAGGACMLAGIVLLQLHFGTVSIVELLSMAGDGKAATLSNGAIVLLLLGAFTKSAQWPFHFWLPNAMVGPAPVSAFLHSATMVKAGVFFMATLAPLLSEHPLWTPLVAGAGLLTVGTAVLRGAREQDLKALLACTTLAALGFLTLLAGLGTPAAMLGFVIFLTAHALYKAPLFLAAGNFEKAFGTRKLDELVGAIKAAPLTGIAFAVSALSLIGLAPMPGFLGKEYLLKATWAYSPMLAVATALAAAGVLGLGLKLLLPLLDWRQRPESKKKLPLLMTLAAVLPAMGTIALVISLPATTHEFLGAAATALGAPADAAFKFWHGWTPAFGLGMGALALSLMVWRVVARPNMEPLPASLQPVFEPLFNNTIEAIRGLAAGVGRLLESGRPGVQICLMLTAVGALAFAGLDTAEWSLPESDADEGTSVWLLLAPVVALAAFVAATARSTFGLLVALGFVGLVVALLFLWFSAPDLALTQLMAETLLLFLLAGVLKKTGVKATASPPSISRAVVALAGGGVVTLLVLKAMVLEWDHPVSDFHLSFSKPAAYGANVVNVILVDFRALDTLGEILVLAIAALGATSALGAARRRSALPFDSESPWLATAARGLAAFSLPVSLWLFWRGHNDPGGGFIAALVAATALGLLLLVRSPLLDAKRLRHGSLRLTILGLAVALGSALLPVLFGKEFFTGLWWHSGDLHLGTPLLFDLGVYLAVLGFCLGFLRHFQPNRI
ncbi:MAG: hydrogen gas-evolving membrane-bound hydrogenase subunit E [Verrucomicrobiota bacterium]